MNITDTERLAPVVTRIGQKKNFRINLLWHNLICCKSRKLSVHLHSGPSSPTTAMHFSIADHLNLDTT